MAKVKGSGEDVLIGT